MYSKITIGGDCDINYIWSTTKDLIESDITTLTNNGISTPIWDESTNLLAIFATDVNGDCVDIKDVIKYVVQKQEYGSEAKTIVCETVQSIIEDYNIGAGSKCKYTIIPVFEENSVIKYGIPMETDYIENYFEGFFIIGLKPNSSNGYIVDTDNIWHFTSNISDFDYSNNNDKTYTNGMGRYPFKNKNTTNYSTIPLSGLLGEVDENLNYIHDDIATFTKWVDFCNSDDLKLFKDSKGKIMVCDIKTHNEKVASGSIEQYTTVNMDLIELDTNVDKAIYNDEVN